ncbi:class I SAM-dependent methyltransferase [Amycolatopsis speibonae]|uniref:Class I SAM-dependent methyltransferase n=1 Tax=Amycolatopsis speibonae TaxID=1450224 RepID=A0ABV7NQX7_9PSEU
MTEIEGGTRRADLFDHENSAERDRLGLVETEQDPHTKARIESFEPSDDWNCLEIGAGAGSIAYWLAGRCPDGHVVATDLDVSLLDGVGYPNLEIRRHDAEEETFAEGTFDLVHARAVLSHICDRHGQLVKMAGWLRPGGWLLLEDPSGFTLDSSPDPLLRKASAASSVMMRRIGFDPDWSRGFPVPLQRAGLLDVGMECRLRMMRGGDVEAELLRLTFGQIFDLLVDTGEITAVELDAVQAKLADPSFIDFPPAFIRAWGRRG